MPLRLLVRARNSPTFPAPASHEKGEITGAAPEGHIWGAKEGLPDFIHCDLAFQNTPDPQWVNDEIQADGGRRSILLDPSVGGEVDAVVAAGGQKTYNNAGQFVSRLVQNSGGAALFVGAFDK